MNILLPIRRISPGLMILLLAFSLVGCLDESSSDPSTVQVKLNGHAHRLEIAATPEKRYQGLSDRQELPADGGMIFVFPQPQPMAFVMRRCLIPLDLVLLDGAGRIVDLHEMAIEPYDRPQEQLKAYRSTWPAQFALELPGGTIRKYGLKKGQPMDIPWQTLKPQAR